MNSSKLFISALVLGSTLILGCTGTSKKGAENTVGNALNTTTRPITITEDIKKECVGIFENTINQQSDFIEKVNQLKSELNSPQVKFFMPLNVADRAESKWQKAQVLGFYSIDRIVDKFLFEGVNGNVEREAHMEKLAADLNFNAEFINAEDLKDASNRKELLQRINAYKTLLFIKSIENNNADYATVTLAYSLLETTVCKIGLSKLINGETDQQKIYGVVLEQIDMMRNFVKLYTLLSPYYESLGPLKPLVEKIQSVTNADEGKDQEKALDEYISYANEMRDQILTQFNLNVK